MTNRTSTRYFSGEHEESVRKELNALRVLNSGAGNFEKGDVVNKSASLLCECKCSMSEKSSFSVKKEWIEKNKQEARMQRLSNTCVAFNFEPGGENYYIIDSRLMKFLVEKLTEEES